MPSQQTEPSTIKTEKQRIKDVAGLPTIQEIILNDRGWDSRVYSFDDGKFFFKFPRSEKVQTRYKYEIDAIKLVADLDTDLLFQKILWEHPTNEYFGYKGVQGVPLSEIVTGLDAAQKQSIGEAIGRFLKQFHSLDLAGARSMPVEAESQQIQRWYETSAAVVGQYFGEIEQKKLYQLVYETWPARLAELGGEPVLSHGDLHFENILYAQDQTAGIIDFGDVAYYDRSKDFVELQIDDTVFQAALSAYDSDNELLMQKITVRQAMIQIINLGFYAGKADAAGIELTVDKIKSKL